MHSVDLTLENLSENYKLNYVAKQACGSVLYQSGGCVILASVAIDKQISQQDFLPLNVQYIQKAYANRKIPGGFIKREGKPSEFEILTSRLIDRTLRPLFPKGYYYPTQITILLLSYDNIADLQVCALHAAANALLVSGLPFIPPVSSVRIGKINNDFVINPSMPQMQDSSLDLYVSGSNEDLLMIEMKGSDENLDEDDLLKALQIAQKVIASDSRIYLDYLSPLKAKPLELEILDVQTHPEIYTHIKDNYQAKVKDALLEMSKSERNDELEKIANHIKTQNDSFELEHIKDMLNLYKKHQVRKMILDSGVRADGRGLEDIRQISIETNILPCVHSSALFTRGQTQALVTCTLGSDNDAQIQEGFNGSIKDRFMFHYNFPGFSVGEASAIGSVGRRELGHGNLAKRALESSFVPVPYTIRLVSEILESNGSSSMASVCGGSLALKACGISNELVAGVAMGLVCENDKYAILTDIMGLEDHDGDMDFKVAGTRHNITAMQMDIKLGGLDFKILENALYQAKRARLKILDLMEQASKNIVINKDILPQSEVFHIPSHKIVDVIGQGGKVIKDIIERFNVSVDLNRENGEVRINGDSKEAVSSTKDYILKLVNPRVYEIGEVFEGVIKKVADFGVFVELPEGGADGLLHITRIPKSSTPLNERFKEGEMLKCQIHGTFKGKIELALASF